MYAGLGRRLRLRPGVSRCVIVSELFLLKIMTGGANCLYLVQDPALVFKLPRSINESMTATPDDTYVKLRHHEPKHKEHLQRIIERTASDTYTSSKAAHR
jgi:hypothetical protein